MLLAPKLSSVNVAGALIVVAPLPAPWIVTLLSTTTCSAYVPAATLIVSPGCAAATASPIVAQGSACEQLGLLVPPLATYRCVVFACVTTGATPASATPAAS